MADSMIPIVVTNNEDDFTASFGEVTLVELELANLENFNDWLDEATRLRPIMDDLRENHGHPGYEAAEYIEEQLKGAIT